MKKDRQIDKNEDKVNLSFYDLYEKHKHHRDMAELFDLQTRIERDNKLKQHVTKNYFLNQKGLLFFYWFLLFLFY